ncbi:hypothetical protein D3C80_1485850 [compost metagenome]
MGEFFQHRDQFTAMQSRQTGLQWRSAWLIVKHGKGGEQGLIHLDDAINMPAKVPTALIALDRRCHTATKMLKAGIDRSRVEKIGQCFETWRQLSWAIDVDTVLHTVADLSEQHQLILELIMRTQTWV